jgi:hypothetical protein
MVTAPVDTTTGLSAPITPTPISPTAEVKPVATVTPKTPVKTEPVIDYTQAKGRESEITANLDSFKSK